MTRSLLGTFFLLWSSLSFAHHGTLGIFDSDRTIDIHGTIKDFRWANPHVRLVVAVVNEQGVTEDWDIELSALSMLRTRGLDQEILHLGDPIGVAGNPAHDGTPSMTGNNLLLPDGTEMLADRGVTPYFIDPDTGQTLEPVFNMAIAEQARSTADGIFRVWATVLDDPASFPMFKGGYPLTDEAAQAKANWVPDIEQQLSCWEKGMPYLMITPHPIEFVQQGDDILLRFEEDNAERLVYMNQDEPAPQDSFALLGYSVGKWEGDTLVVETTHIDAPGFDDLGTPMDKDVRLIERFTLSADQQRLDYAISIVDPVTFSRPMELTRYWVWRPELAVHEWNCVD